jgi:hypothetical protein
MKSVTKFFFIITLVLVVLMAFPVSAYAQDRDGDQFIFGGTYSLNEGEVLNGNLMVFGGTVDLDAGSKVNGSVIIAGGSLSVDGEITGDITAAGGATFLGSSAVVGGDAITIGGAFNQSPGAVIRGTVRQEEPGDLNFTIPPDITQPGLRGPNLSFDFGIVGDILWGFFRSFALAVLAVIVTLFALPHTQRTADAVTQTPLLSSALGLLSIIVSSALLIVLAITIILSPLSLLGIVVLVLAVLFGWIALGLEIGQRLETMFRVNWTPQVSAGIGSLLLALIATIIGSIPCVGWIFPFLVTILGLGAVILTRFGTRSYTPNHVSPLPSAPQVSYPAPRPENRTDIDNGPSI